ncbi:hypothetical protein AJ88_21480 [Mesorhizobium amorphae CCBAU 01583]|nr:hypothetical protein AJ88_21480 [Mesorhizobium amorphae CCBAU 01583]
MKQPRLNEFTGHFVENDNAVLLCRNWAAKRRQIFGWQWIAMTATFGIPQLRGLVSFGVFGGVSSSLPFFGFGILGSLFDFRPSAP